MRTLIDIPEKQIQALSELCKVEKISRSEVIRRAIAYYLEKKKPQAEDAFGLWKGRQVDGLAYQEKMRSEW